jgi:hypothetical protein
MRRTLVIDSGLDRLQAYLLDMAPGDEVSSRQAAELCGLEARHCDVVLSALVRAGLMIRLDDDAYRRCRLDAPQS